MAPVPASLPPAVTSLSPIPPDALQPTNSPRAAPSLIPVLSSLPPTYSPKVAPSSPPGYPAWYDFNLTQTNATLSNDLMRCVKRGHIPPINGTQCSKKSKLCYFGEQNCNCTSHPSAKCECKLATDGRNLWFCVAITCADSCCSGKNVVLLKGGKLDQMKNLCVADVVKTGEGRFSRVYGFGHFNKLRTCNLTPANRSMCPSKLLRMTGISFPAGSIKVGNRLRVHNGELAEIVDIK